MAPHRITPTQHFVNITQNTPLPKTRFTQTMFHDEERLRRCKRRMDMGMERDIGRNWCIDGWCMSGRIGSVDCSIDDTIDTHRLIGPFHHSILHTWQAILCIRQKRLNYYKTWCKEQRKKRIDGINLDFWQGGTRGEESCHPFNTLVDTMYSVINFCSCLLQSV